MEIRIYLDDNLHDSDPANLVESGGACVVDTHEARETERLSIRMTVVHVPSDAQTTSDRPRPAVQLEAESLRSPVQVVLLVLRHELRGDFDRGAMGCEVDLSFLKTRPRRSIYLRVILSPPRKSSVRPTASSRSAYSVGTLPRRLTGPTILRDFYPDPLPLHHDRFAKRMIMLSFPILSILVSAASDLAF